MRQQAVGVDIDQAPRARGADTIDRARLQHPVRKNDVIAGSNVAATPVADRNMGMVFQNYALFPHMTVAENVSFPLEMRKVPREECRRRTEAMLDLIGLKGKADRLPRQLSGGQQQRVAVARALVFNPDILLMDEPLGALDKNLRQSMQ